MATYLDAKTKKVLVTFIITYHDEPIEMLREAITSILALSLSENDREIIIVDDGSQRTDTFEALKDVLDSILYVRQKNRGLSAARNMGLSIANGQYVQFLDSDDALIPNAYEHCLDIVRYKSPDVVLFDFTTKENKQQDVTKIKTTGPIDGSVWMKNNNLKAAAWAFVFRKDILLNLRFAEGLLQEDEAFTPQLILRAENLYKTDAMAYFYRQRSGSIQHTYDKKHITKSLNDIEKIIFHLQDVAATQSHTNRQALERRVAQLTMDYLYNIIKKTGSLRHLENRIERLKKKNLFPLPDKDYTMKYKMFRRMVNSKVGRVILVATLKSK